MKKLCVDCVHCDEFRCLSPKNNEALMVGGTFIPRYAMCVSHRSEGWLSARVVGACGKGGRWFEPKRTV